MHILTIEQTSFFGFELQYITSIERNYMVCIRHLQYTTSIFRANSNVDNYQFFKFIIFYGRTLYIFASLSLCRYF
jgi:hypothetical protein